jgi:hypothetical protein
VFQGISRRCHGGVTAVSRRCHGGVTAVSRRCHGGVTKCFKYLGQVELTGLLSGT